MDGPVSNVAFNFDLRRYIQRAVQSIQTGLGLAQTASGVTVVGRCRLTLSNPS
jgi:hypothetical protein